MNVCGLAIRTHGSVIRFARLDADKYQFVKDPEAMLEGLRQSETRIDLFTFLQQLPGTEPKYSYPMEMDNLAVLPVTTFDNWWKNQIRSLPRNRARQAEKRGAILREVAFDDDLVKGICDIYNECPIRQGRPFPHFGKDLATVRRESATYLDSSVFIGAFLEGKLIGFAKLMWDQGRTQANLMNIVSMVLHRDKAPTNALIAHAVKACAERRIPNLVYQNFSYGRKGADSLSNFKEVNGFQRVDVPRYFVPLTPLGELALELRLHHRFVDRLPEQVVAKVQALRNAWYSRKFQSAAEAA